jgi:glucose/arabinose dehydrogenase
MRRAGILSLFVFCLIAAPAAGATLEPVGTYSSPVYVTSDPADPDRIFVVEQGGTIKLTEGAATSTFLDATTIVLAGGEQGLLSMAFAPDYPTSGRFYVYFTNRDGNIEIDEFTATSTPVDLATRRPVITIPHPVHTNHDGGQLQFGPDGYLYLATGDGGGGGDPDTNGQDLGSLLGKVLRIDPAQSGTNSYTVPANNPFVGVPGAQPEIWSYGLRNPFRFSFDRLTGALLIGDVGQGAREEIDYEPQPNAGRGDNFGWSCREGRIAYTDATPDPACSGASGFTEPIHDYDHTGGNCSITGGYVVRDQSLGDLYGRYLYADFCAGQLRSLVPALPSASGDRAEGIAIANPSSFGEDACDRIYVASLGGEVHRLVGDAPADCTPPPPPAPPGGDPSANTEPDPMPGHPGDGDADEDDEPPSLRLRVPQRQDLESGGKLMCKLSVDEPSDAVARLAVVGESAPARAGADATARAPGNADVLRRFRPKAKRLGPGVTKTVRWRVSRADMRAVRRGSLEGEPVQARFRVRARDSSGNRSVPTELRSRLE